jgi:hypothetical protein
MPREPSCPVTEAGLDVLVRKLATDMSMNMGTDTPTVTAFRTKQGIAQDVRMRLIANSLMTGSRFLRFFATIRRMRGSV